MPVPYIFSTQTGAIELSELDANFSNVKAQSDTAVLVTASAQPAITSVGPLTALSVAGNVAVGSNLTLSGNLTSNNISVTNSLSAAGNIATSSNLSVTGNITGNTISAVNLSFSGDVLGVAFSASGNITGGNLATGGTVSATGNVRGANFNTAGLITATGNVHGGNILTSGAISATGNVSATQLSSNTAAITGNVTAGNVVTSGFISASGNITGSNMVATTVLGTLVTAAQTNITSVGTLTNLNSGAISSSGNVTGANLRTGGVISAAGNITGGNISATAITGTLATASQTNITALGTLSALNVTGTSNLNGVVLSLTAANGTSNTQVATTNFVQNTVTNSVASTIPTGIIVMWSGSIATVPVGWLLCNGGNGTPDLRNRFIIAADADSVGVATTSITGAATQTGGSKDAIVVSHTHSITDPGHNHINGIYDRLLTQSGLGTVTSTNAGSEPDVTQSGTISSNTTGITITATGSSGTNANLPPYYALAYIMKA